MIINTVFMKKILLLFNLILSLVSPAQVIVTLQSKYLGNLLNLDSIIVENLTQDSKLLLSAPLQINSYDIDLLQGKIINDIQEINYNKPGLHENINIPGHFQVIATLQKPEMLSVSLINIMGEIIHQWDIEICSGNSVLDMSVGHDEMLICEIRGKEIIGSFKIFGKDQNPTNLNIMGTISPENKKKSTHQPKADFLFSLGDTLRFTAFKSNMYRNSKVNIPQNGDSILIYLSLPCPGTPSVQDFEGNSYTTVLLHDKCWMRENVKSKHYADGTPLIDGTGVGDISGDLISKYWFDYNDNPKNSEIYGRYYTGAAMMNTNNFNEEKIQGICPNGWHVSTATEWCELEKLFDISIVNCEFNPHGFFGNSIGNKLKCIDTTEYNLFTNSVTDESGFNGLLGGIRSFDIFAGFLNDGQWWAFDNVNGSFNFQLRRVLYYGEGYILRDRIYTSVGLSVRCVKNY